MYWKKRVLLKEYNKIGAEDKPIEEIKKGLIKELITEDTR
jgi:hypothetical protein